MRGWPGLESCCAKLLKAGLTPSIRSGRVAAPGCTGEGRPRWAGEGACLCRSSRLSAARRWPAGTGPILLRPERGRGDGGEGRRPCRARLMKGAQHTIPWPLTVARGLSLLLRASGGSGSGSARAWARCALRRTPKARAFTLTIRRRRVPCHTCSGLKRAFSTSTIVKERIMNFHKIRKIANLPPLKAVPL